MATYNKFLADQKRLWDDLFKDYDPTLSAIYTLRNELFLQIQHRLLNNFSDKSQWINQTATIHPPITELKLTMAMLKLVDVVGLNLLASGVQIGSVIFCEPFFISHFTSEFFRISKFCLKKNSSGNCKN